MYPNLLTGNYQNKKITNWAQIELFTGSDLEIPEASIETAFIFTGLDIGFLNFDDLGETDGIGDLTAFTVRAVDGHFYVNSIAYDAANPVPEPATIALLGIGLAGLAGAEVRRRRKKKSVHNRWVIIYQYYLHYTYTYILDTVRNVGVFL